MNRPKMKRKHDSPAIIRLGLSHLLDDMVVDGPIRDCPIMGPRLREIDIVTKEFERIKAELKALQDEAQALSFAWLKFHGRESHETPVWTSDEEVQR